MKFRKSACLVTLIMSMVFESATVFASENTDGIDSKQTEMTETNETVEATEALETETTEIETSVVEESVTETTAIEEIPATEEVTDPETMLLLAAQEEIAAQGLSLDQYHVINILGDSLTEGVGARSEDKTYPAVLAKLTGAKVNNYGKSGSRITDVEDKYNHVASFIDRMYSMDRSADLVIVFGGTNDFWYGDCPIGKRTDTSPETFYGALNTMMKYLLGAYPNADIVFLTPYQQSKDADETHGYKRSTYNNYGTGTLKEYRTAMLDRCQYYGIPVLDLYADYELNTADNREALVKYGNYLCDGCHLNDAGYNLLARKIYRFIMQDLDNFVPEYTQVQNMVFETAALPALIQNGVFVMPNGLQIACKNGVAVSADMDVATLYRYLMEAVYY